MNIVQSPYACMRGDLTIRGLMIREDDRRRRKAVILSHGFMGSSRDMLPYAHYFAGQGYAAFVFDFCGGSMQSESDGATTDMSVLTECDDLMAVLDDVLAREDVMRSPVTLFGASQGGLVSGLVASIRQKQIGRLLMMFPALCIPDDARRGSMLFYRFDPENPPETIGEPGGMVLGRRYAMDVRDMDVFSALAAYTGDVMIIHGTKDDVVSADYALRMKQRYRPGQCELQFIDGGGHGFTEKQNEAMLRAVSAYLAAHDGI